MKIVEECVAALDIEDDFSHKISQVQRYVVGNFLERKRSTKKGLLFKEEFKKTYFFRESIGYPFVQFSTLKIELNVTNNDFADIIANGLVVKVLDSQSKGPVFKTTGWLQG